MKARKETARQENKNYLRLQSGPDKPVAALDWANVDEFGCRLPVGTSRDILPVSDLNSYRVAESHLNSVGATGLDRPLLLLAVEDKVGVSPEEAVDKMMAPLLDENKIFRFNLAKKLGRATSGADSRGRLPQDQLNQAHQLVGNLVQRGNITNQMDELCDQEELPRALGRYVLGEDTRQKREVLKRNEFSQKVADIKTRINSVVDGIVDGLNQVGAEVASNTASGGNGRYKVLGRANTFSNEVRATFNGSIDRMNAVTTRKPRR